MWGSDRRLAYLGKGKGVGIPEGRRRGREDWSTDTRDSSNGCNEGHHWVGLGLG